MDAAEFAREIGKARSAEERIAWFGALLRRESGKNVEVVGGSAIEVYLTSSAYISQDIDLVGERAAIERILRDWGFHRVEGRSHRVYWTEGSLGLVDIVAQADRSGLPPREVSTPYGPVLLSAPEPLIIRRLQRSARESSEALYRQAVALARLGNLDWQYLESEARFEKVESQLKRLRSAIRQ
jgi:hypothetical protein